MEWEILGEIEEDFHKDLRQTVRRFVKEHISPIADEIDRTDEFPIELFKSMGELGFTGMLIPEEYGGIGEDVLSAIIILEEISKESPSIALSLLAHSVLCAHPIAVHGTPEQKRTYLPKLASAEYIGALAYTEPNAGSDAPAISSLAMDEGEYFVLRGSKAFITNGNVADVLIVYAKTEPEKGKDGISAFIVESNYEGFQVSRKLDKMGMRGSPTAILYLDDVKVPKKNLLGKLNEGYYMVTKGFEIERITISAISIGIALRSLEWMLNYSKERTAFGKHIANFQLIQEKVARIGMQVEVLRNYLYMLARNYDRNKDNRLSSATIKYLSAKLGIEAGLEAIQVLGGNGYIKEYPVERLMRDAKLMDIGAGTSEIMLIQVAKMLYRKVGYNIQL